MNSPPASYYKCHDDEERLGGVRRRRRGSSRSRKKNKGHNQEDVSITHPEEAHVMHEVVVAHHGAVATDDRRCSRIGMEVLREGGHAVDASVATTLCLGIVSPASSGIGGGAFMLLGLSSGKAQAFDMRETAPLQASENMYAGNDTLKTKGALSIAVPGELAGLHEAWKQHGKLPWKRLDVQKIGGILTVKDLQRYRVKLKEPISANILGLKILGMPPPSGAPPMILLLNILAQYVIPSGVSGSLGVHREIEALKHVLSVRMNLGDPDYVDVSKVLSDMLSPKFAKELKKTIYDNMTFDPDHYGGRWNQIHDHGTSHISIVDRERNAISMTTTVNSYFGSQILSPSTGLVLNNEMGDFSIPMNVSAGLPPPAPSNFISPGKRPLSSMTPTIVLKDEHLKAVVGASGGGMIIAGTAEVLLNNFSRGMDPFSSVMAPRVYHQLIPNVLYYENWTTVSGDHFEVPADIRAALRKKGHVLQSLAGGTICQFIVQDIETSKGNEDIGKLVTVSDPRKGGFPAGF
ncbi:Gamma-glutamyltranspeptidase 1 [Morella rubra]|uniref:Gamma-glutamyltranspeptidase 1 n=1 Tax=Morella rubra TaxID=262757 RepID=A0A6A1ULF2_9ROSI|nr:Gamma-glutamyltranspeptidase 1 [Morella rubra]